MKSVHFVCRGNVYRSRLAEAYAASILNKKSKVKVSSSGIEAEKALNGDVDPETERLLREEKLHHHLAPIWHQTTQDDIDKNDLIIFMSRSLHTQANELFIIPEDKVRVWDIPDVDGVYPDIKNKVIELVKEEF